ncbi:MFS transporter [Arthrobacter sp. NPDC056886]|uniref:MFS transporter n=1 Tax=Arthrobacter sp. NPDC056886 TaxID=3345960 RepID=UPI00366C631F
MSPTTSARRAGLQGSIGRGGLGRNFTILWAAQALSSFGEFLLASTLTVWIITDIGGADPATPLMVGAVVAAAALPRILIGPFAGVLTDQWSQKRTMIFSDWTRVGVIVASAAAIKYMESNGLAIILPIIMMTAAVSALAQFFNPARAAVMQRILAPEMRLAAAARSSFATTGVAIVATASGPALYALAGPWFALAFNAVTFALSAFLLVFLNGAESNRETTMEGSSYWSKFADGFKTIWGVGELRLILYATALYGTSLGINNASLSLFALQTLGLSPAQYGIVAAMFPAGSLLVAVIASRVPAFGRQDPRVYVGAIVALGLSYVAYAFSTSFQLAAALMFLSGVFFSVFAICQGPILQRATPPSYMGRMTATTAPIMAISSLAATMLVSVLLGPAGGEHQSSSGPGPQLALLCSAVVLVAGGSILWHRIRADSDRSLENSE